MFMGDEGFWSPIGWGFGDEEYDDQHDDRRVPREICCKYCGEGGFIWNKTEAGWRLVDSDGRNHACRTRPKPKAEIDFSGEI